MNRSPSGPYVPFVLTHNVSTCCFGTRSPQEVRENLGVVDPPYLDPPRVRRLRELFGRIQLQVR